MQCIPTRFDDKNSAVLIQFLERIFPTFTTKEKKNFVSVLYSHYGDKTQKEIDMCELLLKANPSSPSLEADILRLKQRIAEQHTIRDQLLHKLNSQDIVPHIS